MVYLTLCEIFQVRREEDMEKYKCNVCGYIYNPSKGDPSQGVAPGTNFENLSVDWNCPVCGVSKEEFEVF